MEPPILKRMELPVVSLELPPGDVDDTAARQPSSGQLMIKNAAGRGGIVLLGWDASEAYTDEEVATMGRVVTQSFGKATVKSGVNRTVAGVEARTLAMDLGKETPMRLTVWRCGRHNVFLTAWFRGEHLASIEDRILDSVVCREAAVVAPLLPQLRLPAGWARLPSTEDVTFTSVSGETVIIKESPGMMNAPEALPQMTRQLIHGVFEVAGAKGTAEDIELRPIVVDGVERLIGRAKVEVEGAPLMFQAAFLLCPGLATAFNVIAVSTASSSDTTMDDFFQARCPERRDAPEPDFPEAVPYFDKACADGDAVSCARLAALSEDTDYPTLVDAARAERAKKRACELGASEYCPDTNDGPDTQDAEAP